MTKEVQQANSAASFSNKLYKILIVEDDEGLNRLIQKMLQREGYQTDGALTGKEAFEKATGDENEILLIDYKLPDMTGKQLAKKIIDKYHRVPQIIVMTGFGDEKLAVELMKLGVADYIVKEADFIDILPPKINLLCENIERNKKLEKVEEDLRRSLVILGDTGDMARVGGWEVNLEKNTVFWTQSTRKIHEVEEDYVPTMEEAINFFPRESGKRLEKAINKAIRSGVKYDMELPFVTAKGNKLWVHSIGKAEMKDGKCVKLYGTFQDITRRKEAENELKENNEILRRTEKIAHLGSWEWDIATDSVRWSDEMYRIFKLDPKQGAPSYQNHSRIYTPEGMIQLDKAVKECIKTGKSYNLDLKILRGDEKTAYCTVRGYAKKDEYGKVVGLFGSFQDITSRKIGEQKLKKSRERIKLVLDNSPFPVALVDEEDHEVMYWSKSALKLFGHNPKTAEEWYEMAYPNPDYRQEVIERWKPFLETARKSSDAVNTGEYKIHCKNGTLKVCEIYAQFIPDSLIITLNDITEKRESEEQLKSLNQQLLANEQQLMAANQQLQANEEELQASNQQLKASEQQLLASNQQLQANEQELIGAKETAERYLYMAGNVFVSLDRNGDILLVNQKALEILEYDKIEELIGKNWFDTCIPSEIIEQVKKVFAEVIKGDIEGVEHFENEVVTKSGKRKLMYWYNSYIKDEDGQIAHLLSSGSDITEKKKSEIELIKAKERAEESDRLKSAFLANMSHEIRTPMNGILGFTDLLKEADLTGKERKKYIGVIEKSGERMLSTINDIIDISRIESGEVVTNIKPTDINFQLKSLYDFFKPEAERKNVKLSFNPSLYSDSAVIQTDPEKFDAIFTNLIKNAIKYTRNGFIEYGYMLKDDTLHFYTKDSGEGIKSNQQKSIFERFIQEDDSQLHAQQGSGLGLSIVKAYVELLGGEIKVESKKGKGSTFHFTMPYTKVEKETTRQELSVTAGVNTKIANFTHKSIMVVEDDEASYEYLKVLLKSIGFNNPILAKNGKESIKLCKETPEIELVLMDINMPTMNGYEATKAIKALRPDLGIIAQTAYALTGDREKSLEAGCDDYITKPVKKEELLEKMEKLLK